jgi:2-polyprenyl-3-methyl-5-hydroxy-6-metoxy-1,4-benzoquinol methylase
MADSRAVNFPETSYGIVKRLQTIEAWTAGVAQRLGTPSLSILDFGCGTGDHVTYPLACLGHRVLGVDMHEPSIQEAQRRYPLPNLLFRTGHLESLIQEGVAADLIICSEVLEHLQQPRDCLSLMRRLLKPNGALIITTPNGYGSYEMFCRLQRGLTRIGIDQVVRRLVHARRAMQARSVEVAAGAGADFAPTGAGWILEFRIRPCAVFPGAASPGRIRCRRVPRDGTAGQDLPLRAIHRCAAPAAAVSAGTL